MKIISTLLPLSKSRRTRIWSDFLDKYLYDSDVKPGDIEVGTIKYRDNSKCQLMVPQQVNQAQYDLKYSGQQQVIGLHIPAHQPGFAYHRISDIPTDPKSSHQHYQEFQNLLVQLYTSGQVQNPGAAVKRSLMSLGVFGYGSTTVVENPEYKRMFEEFQEILHILLPKVIGFQRLEIRVPDIVFVTESGDFALDAASGGIGAIVGIAWQIFMYGQEKDGFVVTIDEPESHLHPSMQRELLPNLFRAFPKTQFIIATHSPFIVTSSKRASVYALVFDEYRRVNSVNLEAAKLSGTINETLREILGVPITVPVWVEERLNQILIKYRNRELTSDLLNNLKQELIASDLGFLLPEAVTSLEDSDA